MRLLRYLRLLLSVPQKLLAETAGVSVRELQRIEAGEVVPSSDSIRALDKAFDKILHQRLKENHDPD